MAALLESEDDIEVIGEAGTAESAIARIPALRPDVAVLDVRLPDGTGASGQSLLDPKTTAAMLQRLRDQAAAALAARLRADQRD
ncbi:Regulatory protein, LuxR:Response regulator receiver [[Actinomadura] parvosata subsp. kistnae]|nr:Regulatory protein, LuxR:Response regulator receiver [Actinomadura parvosata subsp. kistnae]